MTKKPRISWQSVYETIRNRIFDGTYPLGSKLPRDEDLASEIGCVRTTVQRAMNELSGQGMVQRRRKGGTRVLARRISHATVPLKLVRHEVELQGLRYAHRLIARHMATPEKEVLALLEIKKPCDLLRLEALHLADGRPYIYEQRWVCTDTVPEILDVDFTRFSANEWLVHNRPYSRADLRFSAEPADADSAAQLDTEPGSAVFVIRRTTFAEDAPITSVKAIAAPGYELLAGI